jgi:pilus assembly protein CpaF
MILDWLEKLKNYFADNLVDEVIVNGTMSVVIITAKETFVRDPIFTSVVEMTRCFQLFALDHGMRLDPLLPFAGGQYQRKYRWHCILPPVAESGAIFSLRYQRFSELFLDDFVDKNLIVDLYKKSKNLLICGATGSGKTSFCSALLREYSLQERVCILEEYSEIPQLGRAWMKLIKQPPRTDGKGSYSLEILFKQCLRICPQRIVLGEIKDEEWKVYVQILSSGHFGCIATLHAASLADVKRRLSLSLADHASGISCESILDNVVCVFLQRVEGKVLVHLNPF